ncbi:MAG: hypothetical protein ACRET0_16790 [Steroidobacteraceae bacterium]
MMHILLAAAATAVAGAGGAAHAATGAVATGAAAASTAAASSQSAAAAVAQMAAQAAADYAKLQAAHAAAHPILTWMKMTPVGEWVRDSVWAFPFLQSLHFIGMTMLLGVVGAIDLRVLGVARAIPLAPLHRFLPLAFIGFGINLITGICFFCHDPWVYAFNISFRIKMLLIVLAGLNAMWFRLGVFLDLERWGPGIEASRLAKVISAVSILIWLGVITAGRYIAFT